jgi:predicted GTPase
MFQFFKKRPAAEPAVAPPESLHQQPGLSTNSAASTMLSDYFGLHQRTVEAARSTAALLERSGSTEAAAVGELAARLDAQTVNVVFVGIWSAGKSTLINAILGERRLPMDINVESASIARIVRGNGELMTVSFSDARPDETIPQSPDHIREFMSAKSSRQVESEVREVALTTTNRLCAEGAVLIDTPGVEDLNQVRADVTYRFVPQADFVVFLMNAAQAGQLSELEFLRKVVAQGVREVCFVVNMVDGKDPDDVKRVLASLRNKLSPVLGSPTIFSVSALYALQAKLAGSTGVSLSDARRKIPALRTSAAESWDELLVESGVPALESFLAEQFAGATRSSRMLRSGLERIEATLESETARTSMMLQTSVQSREETERTRRELESLAEGRRAYVERVRAELERYRAEALENVNQVFSESRAASLKHDLEQVIQLTNPDAWRSSLGPRMEIAVLGCIESFSSALRERVRALESRLHGEITSVFSQMDRIAAVDVTQGRPLRASVMDSLMVTASNSEAERSAAAASSAGAGAAVLGGIAGVITLASAAISGPAFPLVAAAIGALMGMGQGVKVVTAQERNNAARAAALEVDRLFDGARASAEDAVRMTLRELETRYIEGLQQRHNALLLECDNALSSVDLALQEKQAMAAEARQRLASLASVRQAVAQLLVEMSPTQGAVR